MSPETFNLLLVVIGAPTVVVGVGIVTHALVGVQDKALSAYLKATEPEAVPAGRSHADSIAA